MGPALAINVATFMRSDNKESVSRTEFLSCELHSIERIEVQIDTIVEAGDLVDMMFNILEHYRR